jgi:hypothetical protein
MVANLLLYVGEPLAAAVTAGPANVVVGLRAGRLELWPLRGGMLSVMLLGVVWGAGFGAAEQHWLPAAPDWQHGLAFGAWPLALSLLLLVPTFRQNGAADAVLALAISGETIRWVVYGSLLGPIYRVFCSRRAPLPPDQLAPVVFAMRC